MKKYIYILLSAIILLCTGCSAEKRLCRFLERHPELQYIDTTIIHDTIFLPEEKAVTEIDLSDLVAMDSIATAALSAENVDLHDSLPSKSVCTDSNRSSAALRAKGNGKFDLESFAKPDTIIRHDTITQLHYITEYKDKEVIIYKQKWWQKTLCWIGAIALLFIIIVLTSRITKKFVML